MSDTQYIVDIIARRDKLPQGEAEDLVVRCRERLRLLVEAEAPLSELEEAVETELGLEPDYLDDLTDGLSAGDTRLADWFMGRG